MSIRTRLFIAFGFLVSLVIIISGIFIFYTQQTKILLDKSVKLSEKLSIWQDINAAFDKQSKSLNYYLVLGEPLEKNKFEEYAETIDINLSKMPQSKDRNGFLPLYNKYFELGKKMFVMPHQRMLVFHDNKILAVENAALDELSKNVKNYSGLLNENKEQIKNFSKVNSLISILFGIFSIFSGTILGLVTFRSIWKPLKTLILGTKEIGEGNLDFKINMANNDEIGILAVNFNQMLENLKKLQLQVLQMDRMSSIGQLAGGVAHEINNPLTGVLGQTQLLMTKIKPDDPAMQHLQRIEHAAQRCRRIVRALLDFAREKNYIFAETDIESLINETLNFCDMEIRSANIEIKKDIQPGLPKVYVSSGHIQQVFLNILNNSVQAITPKKGGKIVISARRNNGNVDISFSDSGIGITKNNIEHVFDPFFTTKEIGSGTGLGLTVSYGIIQKHKGKITAKSGGENQGAEFIVSLQEVNNRIS